MPIILLPKHWERGRGRRIGHKFQASLICRVNFRLVSESLKEKKK